MVAKRSSLAVLPLLAVPGAALALGLGNIHVRSHLDQPLDARIALIDPTPGALQSLTVGVASSATFARYGLNRPIYLNGAQAKVVRAAGGRVIVHITSDQPVTDPILTLLVKASWDRGIMIREYTLLLNPPVYMPHSAQATQAIAAPVVGPAQRVGEIRRPGAAPQPPPSREPAAAAAPAVEVSTASRPHSVAVHRGDTLSGIATRISGAGLAAARTRQWMVAIYRANPQAFDHNMNLLRSGTVLTIPARSSMRQISPAAAWGEIRRQAEAWDNALQPPNAGPGRLRLVAPKRAGIGAQSGAGSAATAAGQVQALKAQVQTLQADLVKEKRLLRLKSAALAQLQALAGHKPAAVTAPPAAKAAGAATQVTPGRGPATSPAATAARAPVEAAALRPQPPAQRSLFDSLLGTLRRYWWAVVGLVVLLAALLASRRVRERRQAEGDGLLAAASTEGAVEVPVAPAHARAESSFDVKETTLEHPRFAAEEGVAPLVARHVTTDETISSETALNLEQGDPLAEADFHMAYGLYDQAADLIRLAIGREPERRDLKLKLLEVFFVWGNKEQFVQTAHELAESRAQAAPGEWEKVIIMGRQLAPEDPLFADAGVSGAASGGVDLDLEGGQARVDFDPAGTAAPVVAGGDGGAGDSLDLDFDTALGQTADTGGYTGNPGDTGTVTDINAALAELDSTAAETGLTREMPERLVATADVPEAAEPTVEQPALPLVEHAALRQKVEALSQGAERTAELAIDDLGLDLGTFETAVIHPGAESADAPTLVAGLDERSRRTLALADAAGEADPAPEPTGTTSSWQIDESELESILSGESPNGRDAAATSRLTALDAPGVDFDVGAEPAQASGGLDFDVGTMTVPHADLTQHNEISVDPQVAELEPITASEVGTKLDLARAYLDMGDPEGARSILEEVMHEGSAGQRQEAGRLLESLPG